MARDMNGHSALVMLGEMRSDLKWLVEKAGSTAATVGSHESRISALEARPRRQIPWPLVMKYAAGLVPLAAALGKHISWAQAIEYFRGLTG